jgi:hypothetical protein
MGETKNAYKVLVRNLKERDHSEDRGADGTIILEYILEKMWSWFIWLRIATSGGLL